VLAVMAVGAGVDCGTAHYQVFLDRY
jgi:hypothetical protein